MTERERRDPRYADTDPSDPPPALTPRPRPRDTADDLEWRAWLEERVAANSRLLRGSDDSTDFGLVGDIKELSGKVDLLSDKVDGIGSILQGATERFDRALERANESAIADAVSGAIDGAVAVVEQVPPRRTRMERVTVAVALVALLAFGIGSSMLGLYILDRREAAEQARSGQ